MENASIFAGTIWSILPPILAIGLALITKEVYFSLLLGIFAGALLWSNGAVLTALMNIVDVMGGCLGDNFAIVLFLVLLGMIVALVTKSGASAAYGKWASQAIKTKRGASLATMALGCLIFVDDYFNCLTVGTVMSPVTDRYKIKRTKLAYIIDATAAPVCIIAPISSWAAAVSSSLPEGTSIDGFTLFLKTIPFNLYAWLTLLMVLFITIGDFDFSKMGKYIKEYETKAEKLNTVEKEAQNPNGRVIDIIIPIVSLIIFCVLAMLYTGGLFSGEGIGIKDAFADCSAGPSLVLGAIGALAVTALLYLPRKVVTFEGFTGSLVSGASAMVPAILILTLAWTLSTICKEHLNLGPYVADVVNTNFSAFMSLLPAILFLVSLGLAFATGTSWGTFAILIPIAVEVFSASEASLVIGVAAILAGAVCGDHISPISDTTIMSSTGAECNHIDHVSTQIPYAMIAAACCFVGYLISGFTGNGWIGLVVGTAALVVVLSAIMIKAKKATKA